METNDDFKQEVSQKTLNWLLEDDNPSIKYRTMTQICESTNSDELEQLYHSIWNDKSIQKMLKKQDENGLWSEKDYGNFTSLRYLTAFAEFGLHKDTRIDEFVEYSIQKLSQDMSKDPSGCAIPLILRALVMLGYNDHPEVEKNIDQFCNSQLYDGGFMCKRLLDKKPERKSCYKATIAALLMYAECKQKGSIIDNTDQLVHYFLKRDVLYTSDKSKLVVDGKPGWRGIDSFFPVEPLRIGLPMSVAALSILGVGNDSALHKAWNLMNEKVEEDGRFQLDGTLSKQPCSFGKVGQPNKWVTFYALLAQKYKNMGGATNDSDITTCRRI